MIYAYVTSETCHTTSAEKRGAYIGRGESPVSKHGDYSPWTRGKRETLAVLDTTGAGTAAYNRRAARAVCDLLAWRRR